MGLTRYGQGDKLYSLVSTLKDKRCKNGLEYKRNSALFTIQHMELFPLVICEQRDALYRWDVLQMSKMGNYVMELQEQMTEEEAQAQYEEEYEPYFESDEDGM